LRGLWYVVELDAADRCREEFCEGKAVMAWALALAVNNI